MDYPGAEPPFRTARTVSGRRMLVAALGVIAGVAIVALGMLLQRDAVSAEIPSPGDNESVIAIHVGGDRASFGGGVSPLAGVVLGLYAGGDGGPTGGAIQTCTSDAQGHCSFIVDEPGGARYWVQQESAPGGWFTNPTLRTGSTGHPTSNETPYRFRTPELQGGQTYESGLDFMQRLSGHNSQSDTQGVWQQSRVNPPFPNQCGLDVALIMDLSLSMSATNIADMKQAANLFADTLVGTPSRMAAFGFGWDSPAGGTNPTNFPTLLPVATQQDANAFKAQYAGWTAQGATNWDRAFQAAWNAPDTYDVVMFITDGNPTVYGAGASGGSVSNSLRDVENAIFSANALKNLGTRVIAIGVGSGVSPASHAHYNLRAVSGTSAGSDYFQEATFDAAANTLRDVALSACQGSINVVKEIVPADGMIEDAISGGAGWTFNASALTGETSINPANQLTGATGAVSFTYDLQENSSGTFQVLEVQQDGYDLFPVNGDNAVCRYVGTQDGVPVTNAGNVAQPGFSVTVGSSEAVTCTIYNHEPAELTIEKRVISLESQTPQAAPGWEFTATGTSVAIMGNSVQSTTGNPSVVVYPLDFGANTSGSVRIDEDQQNGYRLLEVVCTDSTGATVTATSIENDGFTVPVTRTQDIHCVVDNGPIPNPTLTIEKRVIPEGGDTGDSAPASGWEFTPNGNGVTASSDSTQTDGNGEIVFDLDFGESASGDTLTITETQLSGHELYQVSDLNAVCTDDGNNDLTVQNSGDLGFTLGGMRLTSHVHCVVYNIVTPDPPITVVKQIVPVGGSIGVDNTPGEGWTFSAVGGDGVIPAPGSDATDGNGEVTFTVELDDVTHGAVTITETQQSGFELLQSSGNNAVCTDGEGSASVTNVGEHGFSVNVARDSDITCTVYNRMLPDPTVTVVKQIVPVGGSVEATEGHTNGVGWTFAATGGEGVTPTPGSDQTDVDGEITFSVDLGSNESGAVTIEETLQEGYEFLDVSCGETSVSGIDAESGEFTVSVGWGDEVTCTVYNRALPDPTVTVVKQIVPVGGSIEETAGHERGEGWTFTASAGQGITPTPGSGPTDASGEVVFSVDLGGSSSAPVTIAETPQDGYEFLGVACGETQVSDLDTENTSFSVTVTRTGGITCTVYNITLPDPTLTVVKQLVPVRGSVEDSEGHEPGEGWTFTASASEGITPTPGSGDTNAEGELGFSFGLDDIASGGVAITETPEDGYELLDVVCIDDNEATVDIEEVTNGFAVEIGRTSDITCTVYNIQIPAPELTLVKDGVLEDVANLVGGNGWNDEGDFIWYAFTLTNAGNVPLTDLVIDDDLLGDVFAVACVDEAQQAFSLTEDTLLPGESVVCDAVAPYVVTSDDVIAEQVDNVAFATGIDPEEPETPVVSNEDQHLEELERPELTLDKEIAEIERLTASGLTVAGDLIWYQFTLTNTGNVTLTDLEVHDDLLGSVGVDGIAITCVDATLGDPVVLEPGDSVVCRAVAPYEITEEDMAALEVHNVAFASGQDPENELETPVESNEDETVTPLDWMPELLLDKRVAQVVDVNNNGRNDTGDQIWFEFELSNTGEVLLTDLVVNDPLLASLGITITCEATEIDPGASTVCLADGAYIVTADDMEAGEVRNMATATGTDPTDEPVPSNEDETVTPLDTDPRMGLDKTVSLLVDTNLNGRTDPGDYIWFQFRVTNTGDVTITELEIDDPLLASRGVAVGCPVTTLAPGESVVCSSLAPYVINTADVTARRVRNVAIATGTDPGDDPVESNEDATETPVQPAPPPPPPPAAPQVTTTPTPTPTERPEQTLSESEPPVTNPGIPEPAKAGMGWIRDTATDAGLSDMLAGAFSWMRGLDGYGQLPPPLLAVMGLLLVEGLLRLMRRGPGEELER